MKNRLGAIKILLLFLILIPSFVFAQEQKSEINPTLQEMQENNEWQENNHIESEAKEAEVKEESLVTTKEFYEVQLNNLDIYFTILTILVGVITVFVVIAGAVNYFSIGREAKSEIKKIKDLGQKAKEKSRKDIREIKDESKKEIDDLKGLAKNQKEALEKQFDLEVERLKPDLQIQIDNEVSDATDRIKKLEKKVDEETDKLDIKFKSLEKDTIWNQHETACLNENNALSLICLMNFITKSIKYKDPYFISLAIDALDTCLENTTTKYEINFFNKHKYHEAISKAFLDLEKITEFKEELEGFEAKRDSIIARSKEISEMKDEPDEKEVKK